jgi:hypothetical protein
MPASYFITNQKASKRFLVGMIMITILLGMARISVAYAIGPSSFSLEPSFLGRYASAPRAYFTYNSFPGTRIYDSIHITNGGLVRGTISLYPVDAITGEASGTSMRPQNDKQVDVGAWIKLSQQQVTLNPGQSEEIPFTLTIPLHVRPGQHGGIIVAEDVRQQHFTQSTKGNAAKIGIGIQSYIGLGVLVNLPGTIVEHLDATDISYDAESTHQRLLVALANTGTQLLHPSGSLQVTDDQKQLLQNIPITMDTFLPQTSIDYPVYIQHKALALGKTYTATLHLTYEHHHTLNYVTSFYTPLPKGGPITNIVQSLVTPPSDNIFSILTPWHYVIALCILFLILSTSFFWAQKIRRVLTRVLRKK